MPKDKEHRGPSWSLCNYFSILWSSPSLLTPGVSVSPQTSAPQSKHTVLAGPVPTRLLLPESTPLTQWLSIVHSALLSPAKSPSVSCMLTAIVVEWMNQRWCRGGFTPPPCWLYLPPPKPTLNKHRLEMKNRVWLENTAARFLISSPQPWLQPFSQSSLTYIF